MENSRQVFPDLSAACFRDYTQLNSELSHWSIKLDDCNIISYNTTININESQVFEPCDEGFKSNLYIKYYSQNNTLERQETFQILISSQISIQQNEMLNKSAEDQYRLSLYINPEYYLRNVSIQQDGSDFANFYTTNYPDSYQRATQRYPIVQILKQTLGQNNFKVNLQLQPYLCTDQMVELDMCSIQLFVTEYVDVMIKPYNTFYPQLKLVANQTDLLLDNYQIEKVTCDGVELLYNEGFQISQNCKQILISYTNQDEQVKIVQIAMNYQEKTYYIYSYKPGDTVDSIKVSNGQICQIERQQIYQDGKQYYEDNQGNGTSNNTNGTNGTNGTNSSNNTNGTNPPQPPVEEEEEDSNDSISGLTIGVGIAAGLIGLGLIA